jgi:hypothetical protein
MMKNKLHHHLVTCRLCKLEQGHYCHALSEKTAQADVARFYRHLMDKNWMTQELKAETVRLVLEYLGDET